MTLDKFLVRACLPICVVSVLSVPIVRWIVRRYLEFHAKIFADEVVLPACLSAGLFAMLLAFFLFSEVIEEDDFGTRYHWVKDVLIFCAKLSVGHCLFRVMTGLDVALASYISHWEVSEEHKHNRPRTMIGRMDLHGGLQAQTDDCFDNYVLSHRSILQGFYEKAWRPLRIITQVVLLLSSVLLAFKADVTAFLVVFSYMTTVLLSAILGGKNLAGCIWGSLIIALRTRDNMFNIGDIVSIRQPGGSDDWCCGFVERVDIISTVIRTFDLRTTIIPNVTMAEHVVKNWSKRPRHNLDFSVYASLRTPASVLHTFEAALIKTVTEHPDVDMKQFYRICLHKIEPEGAKFRVICQERAGVYHYMLRSDLNLRILEIAQRLNVQLISIQARPDNFGVGGESIKLYDEAPTSPWTVEEVIPSPQERCSAKKSRNNMRGGFANGPRTFPLQQASHKLINVGQKQLQLSLDFRFGVSQANEPEPPKRGTMSILIGQCNNIPDKLLLRDTSVEVRLWDPTGNSPIGTSATTRTRKIIDGVAVWNNKLVLEWSSKNRDDLILVVIVTFHEHLKRDVVDIKHQINNPEAYREGSFFKLELGLAFLAQSPDDPLQEVEQLFPDGLRRRSAGHEHTSSVAI